MKAYKLYPISISDITGDFKDKLFNLKVFCSDKDREALRNITYRSNMYFYNNIYKFNGLTIEFKTQSSDEINDHSIFFLN